MWEAVNDYLNAGLTERKEKVPLRMMFNEVIVIIETATVEVLSG